MHENKLKTINYQNICWFLTISSEFSSNMRKALAMLVGNEVYGGDLKTGYTVADSVFPEVVRSETDCLRNDLLQSELRKRPFCL